MYEIEIDDLWDCSHIEGVGDVKQRNIVEHFQRRLLLRSGTNDEDCCTVVFTQAQEVTTNFVSAYALPPSGILAGTSSKPNLLIVLWK